MKTSIITLVVFLSGLLLLESCKKSSTLEPPVNDGSQAAVHFAIGNQYNWRHLSISSGILTDFYQSESIASDSAIENGHYFLFTTGEILSASGDTVFAYANGGRSIYSRLNVSVGQTVPFLGYLLSVTSVDADTVFQQVQTVVTVSNASLSPDTIISGAYTSRFGLLIFDKQYGTHELRRVLAGARFDTVTYGLAP